MQEELQNLTLRKCIQSIENDIAEMEEWSTLKQEEANREGHLDIKFLNARFARGKQKAEEFLRAKHLYLETNGLLTAQPDTLRFMSSHGGSANGFPGFAPVMVLFLIFCPLHVVGLVRVNSDLLDLFS